MFKRTRRHSGTFLVALVLTMSIGFGVSLFSYPKGLAQTYKELKLQSRLLTTPKMKVVVLKRVMMKDSHEGFQEAIKALDEADWRTKVVLILDKHRGGTVTYWATLLRKVETTKGLVVVIVPEFANSGAAILVDWADVAVLDDSATLGMHLGGFRIPLWENGPTLTFVLEKTPALMDLHTLEEYGIREDSYRRWYRYMTSLESDFTRNWFTKDEVTTFEKGALVYLTGKKLCRRSLSKEFDIHTIPASDQGLCVILPKHGPVRDAEKSAGMRLEEPSL